jgi:molecular chaperone DnaJ
MQKL